MPTVNMHEKTVTPLRLMRFVPMLLLLAGCSRPERSLPPQVVPMSSSDHPADKAPSSSRPSEAELKNKLSAQQVAVTQHGATERPFDNAYWNHHEPGIYVDIVSGQALFSSLDKYDSGSGWPSFTRSIDERVIVERSDESLGMHRVEVRSQRADSHLGHLFHDGPPSTGLRYCINSAALRFVSVEKMAAEGYAKYLAPFERAGLVESRRPADPTEHQKSADVSKQVAIVAGGCFWGVEHYMRKLRGVLDTQVGYVGGGTQRPTYEQVSTGQTGHAEAVQVTFDQRVVSYADVLRYFYRLHDPTTVDRQHNDVGSQYRSAIFYMSEKQRKIAERIKREADQSGTWSSPVVTQIKPAGTFWEAESYHQDYLEHHPNGYNCHVLRKE